MMQRLRTLRATLTCLLLLASPLGTVAQTQPTADVIKLADNMRNQGALFDAIVLYRLVLSESQDANDDERNHAIHALTQLSVELETRGLLALAGEIKDFVAHAGNRTGLQFPTRPTTEIGNLFDRAAQGTLAAPSAELDADQLEWRRLLTGAVTRIASNASAGIVGQPNREILSSALVEGLTGKDPVLVADAVRAAADGNPTQTLYTLAQIMEPKPAGTFGGPTAGQSVSPAAAATAGAATFANPHPRFDERGAVTSGSCKSDLRHLAGRLPEYDLPQLKAVRQQILNENIANALQNARAMGLSPTQAAAQTLESARAAEGQKKVAASCIQSTSNNSWAVIEALETGRYRFGAATVLSDASETRPIAQSCAAGYVAVHYTAVAMKELAVQLACHAAR